MKKNEFLQALSNELSSLPYEEVKKSVDYYSEMIDDRIEDGIPEEDAVAALGSVQSVARSVLLENASLPTIIKSQVKKQRVLKGWELAMLISGSPLWIPLLIAFFIIILSVYIVIWSVIVSLYAAVVSVAVSVPVCIFLSAVMLFRGQVPAAILALGSAFILAGLAILGFMGLNRLARLAVKISGLFLKFIKSIFIGKGTGQ